MKAQFCIKPSCLYSNFRLFCNYFSSSLQFFNFFNNFFFITKHNYKDQLRNHPFSCQINEQISELFSLIVHMTSLNCASIKNFLHLLQFVRFSFISPAHRWNLQFKTVSVGIKRAGTSFGTCLIA